MRIVLVYPPITMMERYSSDIGNSGGRQIPLGIFYIASYLRQFNHSVHIIDAEAGQYTEKQVVDQINDFNAQIVGISSTTVAFHRACELANQIKKCLPKLPIILGGSHITASVKDAMQAPDFDFGVVGEGEVTIQCLIKALENNEDLSSIDGIAYRTDDRVYVTAPRKYISDLDSLPFPAYDLLADFHLYTPPPCNYKKNPVANIITSRGCPNLCTFCDRSVFGRKLRQRSADNIAKEIEYLYHQHGVREIAFVDDTFTINTDRIISLFDILDRKKISFPWTCMSRINTVDFEFLKFIKSKGCWHISFGIESGDPTILKNIKKVISLKKAREVIQWCQQLGILSKGFFIIGNPGETLKTINQTIRTALDLPLDDVVVTLNTPLPGTDQYVDAMAAGKLVTMDWTKFNMWNPVYIPDGLTKNTLLEKHREFYRRFYLRPRILWRYCLSFFSPSGFRRFALLFKSLPFLVRNRQ